MDKEQVAMSESGTCAAMLRPFALSVAMLTGACADPGSPEEVIFGTSTGGVFDEDEGAGEVEGEGGGGADTTGGGPHETPGCLVDDDPEGLEYGYRFQCDGSFTVRAQFTYTGGDPFDEPQDFIFGQEFGEDSYEAPLVMACCRAVNAENEECDEPHFKACTVDLIEQGCRSIGPKIATEANNHSGIVKDKMNQLAKWVNEHQEDCRDAFFVDTGLRDADYGCGEPDPESFLDDAQWVANTGVSGVSAITLTIEDPELFDYYPDPWHEMGIEPAQCASDNYNNDIFFVETGAGPGDTKLLLDAGSMTLTGEVSNQPVEGDGELRGTLNGCTGDKCSAMAFGMQSNGAVTFDQFLAMSHAPADVGTSSQTVSLDRFRVELWESALGSHTNYTNVVIPPLKAQFIVSTTAEDACYGVIGVNETQIVLQKIRNQYWSASTFTIVYEDEANETWDLVMMPSRWR